MYLVLFRVNTRFAWKPIGEASSMLEAIDLMRGRGDFWIQAIAPVAPSLDEVASGRTKSRKTDRSPLFDNARGVNDELDQAA